MLSIDVFLSDVIKLLSHENRLRGNSPESLKTDLAYWKTISKLGELNDPEGLVIAIREYYKTPNSQRRALLTLRKVLRLLGKDTSWIKIPGYRTNVTYGDLLDSTEISQLYSIGNTEDRAILTLLLWGLRKGEILNLKLSNFRVQGSEVFVSITISKTTAGIRTLLIPSRFAPSIIEYLNDHNDKSNPEAYFLRHRRSWLTYHIKVLAARAGLPGTKRVYCHLFRHTSASSMIRFLSPIEMKSMFGWSSTRMLDTYCKINPTELHDRLREVFG